MQHAEVRDHDVKFGIPEGKMLRICLHEGRGRHPLVRQREHRRGEIHTDDVASAAEEGCRHVAMPAAEVERFLVGSRANCIEEAAYRLVRS
jgi:hypothetical protein